MRSRLLLNQLIWLLLLNEEYAALLHNLDIYDLSIVSILIAKTEYFLDSNVKIEWVKLFVFIEYLTKF